MFGEFAASFHECDIILLNQFYRFTHDMSLGVTTIAGGYSKKMGNNDGPAQNATFSDDFDLTFVPGICALLISDHGNQLVRQINLKAEDCSRSSHSGMFLVIII